MLAASRKCVLATTKLVGDALRSLMLHEGCLDFFCNKEVNNLLHPQRRLRREKYHMLMYKGIAHLFYEVELLDETVSCMLD
jgi:hypothetical protein